MIRPEEALHRQVASYLNTIPGLLWWHVPNGGWRSKAEAGIMKTLGVRPGVPDICFIAPQGKAGFLELKAPGGKVTPTQRQFMEDAMEKGALVGVCYSLADVADHLNTWLTPFGYRIPRIAA